MSKIPPKDLPSIAATLTAAYWTKTKNVSATKDDREAIVTDYLAILKNLEQAVQ